MIVFKVTVLVVVTRFHPLKFTFFLDFGRIHQFAMDMGRVVPFGLPARETCIASCHVCMFSLDSGRRDSREGCRVVDRCLVLAGLVRMQRFGCSCWSGELKVRADSQPADQKNTKRKTNFFFERAAKNKKKKKKREMGQEF